MSKEGLQILKELGNCLKKCGLYPWGSGKHADRGRTSEVHCGEMPGSRMDGVGGSQIGSRRGCGAGLKQSDSMRLGTEGSWPSSLQHAPWRRMKMIPDTS